MVPAADTRWGPNNVVPSLAVMNDTEVANIGLIRAYLAAGKFNLKHSWRLKRLQFMNY